MGDLLVRVTQHHESYLLSDAGAVFCVRSRPTIVLPQAFYLERKSELGWDLRML